MTSSTPSRERASSADKRIASSARTCLCSSAADSLDLRALRDDDGALVGHEETPAILLAVVADHRLGRDLDVFVDDGALDARVAADADAVEEDALFDLAEGV